MRSTLRFTLLACCCALAAWGARPDWKAGVASTPITPRTPVWMAGYSARTQPSQGTLLEIHAKALALEDRTGKRYVLVAADLLGFTARVSDAIAKRAEEKYGLTRDRLILNATHTHAGPVIDRQLAVAYNLTDKQWADVDAYTRELQDKVVETIGHALGQMRPARLALSHSQAGFAKNRRNPDGPADHDVPVLRVEDASGRLMAAVFGYACHNTTLPASICLFNGDYAGFTQAEIEKKHPGATALFITGCGADANPHPRGTEDLARAHGSELAKAVEQALAAKARPVTGPLGTAFERIPLAFDTPPTREELKRRLEDKNEYVARHAREMLAIYDRDGRLPTEYPYPVQVWQFGRGLTWIALAGEVVVDYNLKLKEKYGAENVWVSGYNNDVFAYIPSLRVLKEGGYEGGGAMIYYVQPGPWAASVEDRIMGATERLVKSAQSGRK